MKQLLHNLKSGATEIVDASFSTTGCVRIVSSPCGGTIGP